MPDDRRIPFEHMVYIADGPSDVPVFSILSQYGASTYAVYNGGSSSQFRQVKTLAQQGRVQVYGPADYSEGTHTDMWLRSQVEDIALRMVRLREEALGDRVGRPPRHILEQVSGPTTMARPETLAEPPGASEAPDEKPD